MIDRHDLGVLPLVITRIAQLAGFGKLRLVASGLLRTVEEQGSAALAGADDGPAKADLLGRQIGGFLVLVGVVVVRLDPGDQVVISDAGATQTVQVACVEVLVLQRDANRLAVIGSGCTAAALAILGIQCCVRLVVQAGVALQHFAVLVLRPVLQNDIPIRGVVEFARKLDVLAGIEAETIDAIIHGGLQEVVHAAFHRLVGGVQVPQAQQLAMGHLPTVGIVDVLAVAGVLVMEVFGIPPIGIYCVPIRGEVVGHHVHDDADAMGVRGRGHLLQISLGADHEVADGGVGRLIHVVPVFGELLAVGGHFLDLAHRFGLDGGVAGFGDLIHMLRDGVERPHPCVQDCAVLHVLGQTVLLAGRLERGIAGGVGVAVTVGAGLCRGAGNRKSAEDGRCGGNADDHLLADLQT